MYIILNSSQGNQFPININGIMKVDIPEHYIDKEFKSKIIYLDETCIYCYETPEEINNKILEVNSKHKARFYKSEILDNFFKIDEKDLEYNRTMNKMIVSSIIDKRMKEMNLNKKGLSLLLKKQNSFITRFFKGNHNFSLNIISDLEVALNIKIINK